MSMDTTCVNKHYKHWVRNSHRKQWSYVPLQTQTYETTFRKRRTEKLLKVPNDENNNNDDSK